MQITSPIWSSTQWYEVPPNDMKFHPMIWNSTQWYSYTQWYEIPPNDMKFHPKFHPMIWSSTQWYEVPPKVPPNDMNFHLIFLPTIIHINFMFTYYLLLYIYWQLIAGGFYHLSLPIFQYTILTRDLQAIWSRRGWTLYVLLYIPTFTCLLIFHWAFYATFWLNVINICTNH